ncbi:MAG TPA: hypothetical protein VF587_05695 [Solirubrobacteraceae bacterium]|jgi:hypothetical protein
MTDRDIMWIGQLDEELARVAREAEGRRRRSPARPLRGRAALLAGLAALLLAGAATAAVTGVFEREPDGLVGATDKGVVGAGRTERGTEWQLMHAQEGGSFCLALRVLTEGEPAPGTHATCGGMTPGTPGAAIGAGAVDETLLFGTVPDEASAVEISADGAPAVAAVVDDDSGITGKFFVIELPHAQRSALSLSLLDDRGQAIGEARDVDVLVRDSSPLG